MRMLNSRGLSQNFGRRTIGHGMSGLGEADQVLAQRQVELAQVQAERQAVEAELADLKAREADRVAVQRGARSRGVVVTSAPQRRADLDQGSGEDLMDRVGPAASDQPGLWEQIQSAPPAALAVAGLAAVFVVRAIMKKGS